MLLSVSPFCLCVLPCLCSCLSVGLSVYVCYCLSVCLSVCLCVCLSVCMCYLRVCVCVCLSVYVYACSDDHDDEDDGYDDEDDDGGRVWPVWPVLGDVLLLHLCCFVLLLKGGCCLFVPQTKLSLGNLIAQIQTYQCVCLRHEWCFCLSVCLPNVSFFRT